MKKMNTLSKLLIAAVLPAIWQPVFAASSSFSSLSNFSYQLFDLNNQDGTAASITFFDAGYSASATVLDGQAADAGNGNVYATTSTAGSSASASIADTHSTGGKLPSSISVTAASTRFDAAYGNASFLSNFALSANTRVVFFAASSFNNFVTSESESAQSFAGLYAYSNVQYVFDELANDTLPIYDSNHSIYSGNSNSAGRVLSISFENATSEQTSGTLYATAAAHVYSPITAVPEPSSYAMLTFGLCLLGLMSSQRRKQKN